MNEDEAFLRAILAAPEDSLLRLIYADWLEERGDRRSEYLRLEAELSALPDGSESAPALRQRLVELRAQVPDTWLALLGDHRAVSSDKDFQHAKRLQLAAKALGRPVQYVDDEGFTRQIVAAAIQGLTGALAYVESRTQVRGQSVDVNYHLRLRDPDGQEAARMVESYNPYFGCKVEFLDWYGNVALLIYREKHNTYVCRFGLKSPARFKTIAADWALAGRRLVYRGHRATNLRRLGIPGLEELPPLSAEAAAEWGLLSSSSGSMCQK